MSFHVKLRAVLSLLFSLVILFHTAVIAQQPTESTANSIAAQSYFTEPAFSPELTAEPPCLYEQADNRRLTLCVSSAFLCVSCGEVVVPIWRGSQPQRR
jgi:hypothetical protein